jgi:glycopeptide antibiotics resistance protein
MITFPTVPRLFVFIPWFVPGVVISVILAIVLSPALGRWLRAPIVVAFLLIVGAGAVVSATLTPLPGPTEPFASCDFSRVGLAPLSVLTRINETSLNVLLFVPLGVAVGLLPHTRRGLGVTALALASPLLIEATQSLVPVLGRGCQSADVVDNLTGLVIGWTVAVLLGWMWHQVRVSRA